MSTKQIQICSYYSDKYPIIHWVEFIEVEKILWHINLLSLRLCRTVDWSIDICQDTNIAGAELEWPTIETRQGDLKGPFVNVSTIAGFVNFGQSRTTQQNPGRMVVM